MQGRKIIHARPDLPALHDSFKFIPDYLALYSTCDARTDWTYLKLVTASVHGIMYARVQH